MRLMALAAMAVLLAATGVCAETPAAPAPDPVRLQLARELFEVSGGVKAAEASVNAIYANMNRLVAPAAGNAQATTISLVFKDFQAEMIKAVPQIIDVSVPVYANVYTEQELRDYLAWLRSDTGQSIIRKTPVLRAEILEAQVPMMQALMPKMMHKAMDRVCQQSHCTDRDRQMVDAVIANVLKGAHG